MTARTIDPTTLRRVVVNDFRDALDAFTGDVPIQPDGYTPHAITTLLRDLRTCEGHLLMLQRLAEQRSTCDARLPQDSGFEWDWERA